jgi:hypothetical protein
MTVPSNTPYLTLGPQVFTLTFGDGVDPVVAENAGNSQMYLAAAGWPCFAPTDDAPEYYSVYYKVDDQNYYGGNPTDPENPHLLGGAGTLAFKTIVVSGQDDVVADSTTDTLTLVAGTGMTITTDAATDTITFASSGGGGASNSFVTIAVSGQTDIVADSTTDTLTVVAGSGITITTTAASDTLTIANSGALLAFSTIAVSGQSNVVADAASDTLTLVAGSGMTITTNAGTDTITFASTATGTVTEAFKTIAVSGQSDIVADSATDTLTVADGGGTTITTTAGTDTLTIAANLRFYRTTGTISAASYNSGTSELTLGSGNAKRLTLKSGETTIFELGANPTVTIYNTVTTTVPTGKTVQCKLVEGLWVIDVEDCG